MQLASIRTREGDAEPRWLSDMVITLGIDGMSLEESDEEDFMPIFHIRKMPWRWDLLHELQIIDSHFKGDVSQGPKSAKHIQGLTQLMCRAVEGLSKSLYDSNWLACHDSVPSNTLFPWMNITSC